jgi:hypothetical protein
MKVILALLLLAVPLAAKEPSSKKVWVLTGVTVATAMLDVEGSKHCIAIGTCREGNPVLAGASRAEIYGWKGIATSNTTILGWWIHKYVQNRVVRKLWWVPQAAAIGANLYGASTSWRYWRRRVP